MRDTDDAGHNVIGWILLGIGLVVSMILFASTYYSVDQYERVVLTRFGEVVDVKGPGLNFKLPVVNSIHTFKVDNQTVKNKDYANTYTVDNQEIDVLYELTYRLPVTAPELIWLYTNAINYEAQLNGIVLDRLKIAMGKINVTHVANERGKIRDDIMATLAKDIKRIYGIEVIDFRLVDLKYGDKFRKSVEEAASAKAGVETQIQLLEQVKKQAEQVEAKAKGEALAVEAKARADALAIEWKGLAEAKSIEAQAKALALSTNLIELRKVEKWLGGVPSHMYGSAPIPFVSVDNGQLKK